MLGNYDFSTVAVSFRDICHKREEQNSLIEAFCGVTFRVRLINIQKMVKYILKFLEVYGILSNVECNCIIFIENVSFDFGFQLN